MSHGSLKALHQFLQRGKKDFAVRIYDGPLAMERFEIKTPQGEPLSYQLLSLPLYLTFRLKDLVETLFEAIRD